MKHQVDHRDSDHRLAAVGQHLVVFAVPAVSAQPRERPLHDPPLGQHLEPGQVVAAFDDFQEPATQLSGPFDQLAGIAPVGPDQLQPREQADEFVQDQLGPVAVLDIARMYDNRNNQAERIDDNVPFPAVDLLSRVVAVHPPFSVVFTDWLSMTAADGVDCLPAARRTCSRRRS